MNRAIRTISAPVQVTDFEDRPALGVFTTKPAVRHGGSDQAGERQTPDRATYVILNDENGNERGGLVAASEQASLSLDYSNAEAVELYVDTRSSSVSAGLTVRAQPPHNLSLAEAGASSVPAAQIGWNSAMGSCLALHDSQGRPRIVLSVGPDDVPRVQVIGEDGTVVRDLVQPA